MKKDKENKCNHVAVVELVLEVCRRDECNDDEFISDKSPCVYIQIITRCIPYYVHTNTRICI